MSCLRPLLIVLVISCFSQSQDSASSASTTSLGYSCLNQPFLSISASVPKRDEVPQVGISVSDPLGRTEDFATKMNTIPNSAYGPVVEIRSTPARSKALALQICDPEQGTYEIKLTELGDDPYRVTVRGRAPHDDWALILHHVSRKGRIRRYKFVFRIERDKLVLKWLYKDGSEWLKIEPSEW